MNASNRPDSETREMILRTAATLFFERAMPRPR